MLGHLLVEYNFQNHVASDVAIGQLILETWHHKPTSILSLIGQFRTSKKKKLDQLYSFTRSRAPFSTRLTLNDKVLERKSSITLLGVWLQEDGRWDKNIAETCKSAYQRVSMLTKLSLMVKI